MLQLKQPGSQAPVTLSAAVAPQIAGVPTGAVTFSDGGTPLATVALASGAASYSTGSLSSGTHTFTASYSGDANFLASSGTLTGSVVQPAPDFSLALSTAALTVASGQTGSVALQIAPVGGLTANLQLACAGLPKNASCSLAGQQQIGVSGAPVSVQLQIATAASTVAGNAEPSAADDSMLPAGAKAAGAFAFAALCMLPRKRNSARFLLAFVASVAAIVAAGGLLGCEAASRPAAGPASANALPGTYNLSVTLSEAGSGSIAHSIPLVLVVQ